MNPSPGGNVGAAPSITIRLVSLRRVVPICTALMMALVLSAVSAAQAEPRIQLQGQPYSQGAVKLHLFGSVGAPTLLFYGLNPLETPVPTTKGPFFVGSVLNALPLGVIPALGRIDVPIVLPPISPVLAGIPVVLQGYMPGALTNPATLPLDQPYYVPASATILVSPNPTVAGHFGDRVAVGDLNGDGAEDVVVGAWKEDAGGVDFSGRAYVFWGPDLIAVTILEPPAPLTSGLFGNGLFVADFNQDGIDDLIVSEGDGDASTVPGHFYMYPGAAGFSATPGSTTTSLDMGVAYSSFGHAGSTEDYSGDDAPDIAIGTPLLEVGGVDDAGRIEVYPAGASAGGYFLLAPDFGENGFFGDQLASGDVNNDGISDLVVGAPRKNLGGIPSMGRVYVFIGPGLTHLKTIEHPDPDGLNSRFGNAVVAHDMNGDGRDDVITTDQRNHAYVYWAPAFDSFTRIHRPPDPVTGTTPSVSFGYFAAAGDVNADGAMDVIIGEPFAGNQGRVYAALGPYFASFRVLSDQVPEAGAMFGWGVHVRDIDADGRAELLIGSDLADPDGVSGAGRVTVFDFGF